MDDGGKILKKSQTGEGFWQAVPYTHLDVYKRQGENKMALLEVQNVKKIYTTRFGGNQVEALKNVSFSVEKGEYLSLIHI